MGEGGGRGGRGDGGTGKWNVSCSLYSLKYYYRSKKEKIYQRTFSK